jgi:putative redox protein
MTAKVIYTGDLRTVCTHLHSGSTIETDAPTDNHGKGERFSPTDLVATALATCIVTTIGIKTRDMHVNINGLTCEVQKIMTTDPRRIAEIKIHMVFPKTENYSDKEKTIMERVAHTCPVAMSLHPDLKQTLSFEY